MIRRVDAIATLAAQSGIKPLPQPSVWKLRPIPVPFIPILYLAVGIVGGFTLPRLEQAYLAQWTGDVSATTAIAFYSTVASGMLAFVSVAFAIAFVVIQFGAVAYSPRIVIVFGRDRGLYHTLGLFFMTFCYSLAAMAWTDRGGLGKVPTLSSYLVIALAILSLVMFARLIGGLGRLQVHNVLRSVGAEGRKVILELFPRIGNGQGDQPDIAAVTSFEPADAIQTVTYSGEPLVIASFDTEALVRLAESADAVIAIQCGVGETLLEDTVVLHVYGAAQKLPEDIVRRAIRLSTSRTFDQDPKYAIRLLVDVAIRALSPAVNDPTTAVQAIDQIEDLLRRLGRRQLAAGYVRDTKGAIRLTFPVPTWEDYLALSFDEIRQFGATSVQVVRRLRAALVGLSESIAVPERRDAVVRCLGHLDLGVGRSAFDQQDQLVALQEDRQGLGLSRKRREEKVPPGVQPQKPSEVPV